MEAGQGCSCGETAVLTPDEQQVRLVLQKHPCDKEYLIPILQDVQDVIGFLPSTAMVQIGRHLGMRSA